MSRPGPQKVIQPLAATTTVDLICSILTFVKLRPKTIFQNIPGERSEYDKYFETIFTDFVACLSTDEARIRAKASPAAQALMTEPVIVELKESLKSGSTPYHVRFWQST